MFQTRQNRHTHTTHTHTPVHLFLLDLVLRSGVVIYLLFSGEHPFGEEHTAEFTKYQTACVEAEAADVTVPIRGGGSGVPRTSSHWMVLTPPNSMERAFSRFDMFDPSIVT